MRRLIRLLASTFVLAISVTNSSGQVTADFTANQTQGCGSLQVNFTDLSSSTEGSIVSWDWELPIASNVQNPGRIYGNSGCYDICLTVTDSEGNTATECKPCFIQVFEIPQAEFMADPEAGCSPLNVNFIDESTSADGAIIQWIWGLGGSSGVVVDDGMLPEITSTYTTPDQYTISLTVQDENGCIGTATKNDYVLVAPDPIVEFSAPTTVSCTIPFIVNFINDGNTTNMIYQWNFGNGTFYNGTNPPPVVYNTYGQFTPCVIGIDTVSGCSDTLCLVDYIQVGNPIDFSYSTESGCEDLTVNFTDNSIDAATEVIWDFGNGDSSTVANPSYIYTNPGCYTVTLTREVNGCVAFKSSDVCIEVFQEPTVSYSNNNPTGCFIPHTVQFASSSNNAISWLWEFGDASTSTEQNPSYTYTTIGDFTVTLTVTNNNGCTAIINTDHILIQEIQAVIPSDTIMGCTPLDVTLTSISISPTPIVSWEWQVTNNNATPPVVETSSLESPDFSLVDTGFYEIRLIVTNDQGCIDTTTYQDLIAVGTPPQMAFDANPTIGCVETPITFSGMTSDYTNDWLWEFGDGGFGYGENPEHEYVDTGYFDVTLYAYHYECEAQLTMDSFIYIQPPIAGFAIDRFCETPFDLNMIDNSIGADSIFWDFGIEGIDTDTSSEREPNFTYPFTGDFTITMTVFNFETECSDELTVFVQIRDINSDFNVTSPIVGCVPLIITFEDLSQDVNVYGWNAPGGDFSSATDAEPTLTYTTPGKYTDIELIVTDVNGCLDTLIFTDTITANGVNPEFTIDQSDGCRPLTVTFTDSSSSAYGNLTNWDWDFGGGAPNVSDQNSVSVFENIGAYDISLTVTDDWGCTATSTIQEGVEVTFPLVSFYADTISCTSHDVSFTNTSEGHTLAYLWDFGNGDTSTVASPSYSYPIEGIYSICLTATDVNGCDSTYCKNDYVVIGDPVAGLSADTTYATCPPLIVNFENQSINSNQFVWDFGNNGGTSDIENPSNVFTEPGYYDVTLISSFNGYCADTLFINDYIHVEGPVGSFSFDIDSACIPATITFYGESVDVYDYTWDFGNGVLQETPNVMFDTIQYEYDMVGKYVPKLILQDANSCSRAFESSDTIYLEELNLDFLPTDSILCSGEDNTTFLNLSNSSLPISSIEWIFDGGNPGTSNTFEPTISYDLAGVYDVTLISSNGSCTDTLFRPAAIKVGETPVAVFSMSDTLGCAPFPVNFTDLSTVSTGFISGWEWVYDDGDSSFVQNPTHVFDGHQNFNVNLTVTTDIGCTDEISNTVETFPIPEAQVPGPYNICMGNVITLEMEIISDPTNLTYHWLPSPSLSCTDCLTPDANPIDTTIYYFVIENEIGCTDTSEILVEVRPFPAPIVNINNDTTICANSIIQITATGGISVFEYQWDQSAPGLSCYENCNNPIASPEVSTTYTVTVTNQYACSTIRDVDIEVIDESQPFAGDDITICEGNSTQLNTDFGNDPVWLVTTGLDCTYCADPVASPDETTTYVVSVTTDIGCEVIDTLVVNVMNDEDVDAGTDNVICIGESIELDGFGTGDIVWSPDNSLDANDIINPTASPSVPTTYHLTVTNDECVISDSVNINVVNKAEVFAESETICLGEDIELFAYGSAESFSWSPASTLSDSLIADPIAAPTETTTYIVTGSLGSCVDDTAHVTVTVVEGPETSLAEIYDFFTGQTVEVEVLTDGIQAYSYAWEPIDLVSCVSCNNPQITPDSTLSMAVTVTDPLTGCWTVDSTMLRLNNTCPTDLIGVPNIFTPNNDGNNDLLELHLSPAIQVTGIEVWRIFDRWGAQVFEGKNAGDVWDGTFKGQKMPNGVYVYYVEAPCPIGEGKMMKKGDITLIR